jgi:hypothetical protein
MFDMLIMFYVVKCILMNYMLNLLTVKSYPLLLENVALRMGNLQVIKTRGIHERTPHILSRCSDT